MERSIIFLLLIALILTCCAACDDKYNYDNNDCSIAYENGYEDGYEAGYEEAEELFGIICDDLETETANKNDVISLMFKSVYEGKELKNGEVWKAGNFLLRYHLEQEKYLYFDIQFTDFDIKTMCNSDSHDFIDSMPVTAYIGFYDESANWTITQELFVGEKIICNEFEFTSDGYLTDYNDYSDIFSKHDTLYILLFVNEKAYAASYCINSK